MMNMMKNAQSKKQKMQFEQDMGSVHSSFGEYENENNYQNSLEDMKDNKLEVNFENAVNNLKSK